MVTLPNIPAFPTQSDRPVGLSIRELMALHIMAGFAAAPGDELPTKSTSDGDEVDMDRVAEMAVDWADALIHALNRPPAEGV